MKKVLIVSYYWPPAGGPGSIRIVKFAKYLSRFGWEPVILTVENGEYPYRDNSLEKDLPPDLAVYRTRSPDPFKLYKKISGRQVDSTIPIGVLMNRKKRFPEKISSRIRANIFIPDARIGWVPFAVSKAEFLIRKYKINLIFVSSPPHSSQLIGYWLKKKTGLPVVADLRDPWTDIRYYEFIKRSKFARMLDAKLERAVLEKSDKIVTVSDQLIRLFMQKSARIEEKKFVRISNGFDEADFRNLKYDPESTFNILHTGNLQENQNPEILWELLREKNSDGDSKYLKVDFIGRVHPSVMDRIKQDNLQNSVNFFEFMPHEKILSKLKNATLLLMVIPRVKNNLGIVTGKFFEYLGSNRPILVIGPPQSDVGKIISRLKNCTIFDYQDLDRLRDFIEKAKLLQQQNDFNLEKSEFVDQFSRHFLTRRLAEVFDKLV